MVAVGAAFTMACTADDVEEHPEAFATVTT
jgi:hypothetical protein